ncbi:hypothetical protein [Streptacidiphilus jiangxiensis]|uniref:PPE family protein n=1 Tax=Streptacidiphilus jiangxiensis TaxID=235985 RepID=A0A1H7LSX4_STRJI|nr:hypothetical protein [Streptacidiphilus jiangxiensis]SEL01457.1 hypothetical protein SAMN05414137_1055 [Streptacidiphilus jiangxiensis]
MIANADPSTLDTVAARWAAIDVALRQAQDDLAHHTRAATAHWSGAAADAFSARAEQLHASLGNGADFASHACSGVSYAADALRQAHDTMPPEPASLEGVIGVEQASTVGTSASALHEQQRRLAVTVMERLEAKYDAAAQMFGMPASLDQSVDIGRFPPEGGHTRSSKTNKEPLLHISEANRGQPRAINSQPGSGALGLNKNSPQPTSPQPAPFENAVLTLEHSSGEGPLEHMQPISSQSFQPGFLMQNRGSPLATDTGAVRNTYPPFSHANPEVIETHPSTRLGKMPNLTTPAEALTPNHGETTRPATTSPLFGSPEESGVNTHPPETITEVTGGLVRDSRTRMSATVRQGGIDKPFSTGISGTPAYPGHLATESPTGSHDRQRKRPRYLVEDSDTWLSHRRTNPSVIT